MTTSIGKLSKSFFVKLLVGIIILPFVFWGMGDVFRGGNQNVIATIDSKKISTQEFMNYFNQLNLDNEQIKNLPKTDLIEKILSQYIGKRVMALEIQDSGIVVNDNSLRDIIKNDQLFFKNKKFSRTEYEKFLLKSGTTASVFEKNIAEQESKRQFLDLLASGIVIPNKLIQKAYNKENQIKKIKYIDLDTYYSINPPSKDKIEELYEKNKDSFIQEFKSIQFAEILPQLLSGNNKYDEAFFKQLDILENNVLDGQSFNDVVDEKNLKNIKITSIDSKKKDKDNNEVKNISDELFQKINSIQNEKSPQILKIKNKYFIAEIETVERKKKSLDNPDVLKILNAQVSFLNKIEKNTSIVKDISMGGFDKNKIEKFAGDNKLEIKDYTITSMKENEIFSEGIIKRIFEMKDGTVDLITDSKLTNNFLVLSFKTNYKKLDRNSDKFEQYQAKAKLDLVNKIYGIYDVNLNQKYKVELNRKTIDRVKNSF